MKIEALSENKIIVDLSRDDMDSLEITYDDMDYSNIETRRVIWTILDRAKQTLGRDIDPSGKLLIEAVPKSEGGCLLYFTIPCETKPLRSLGRMHIKKERFCFICEFDSFDGILECVKNINLFRDEAPSGSLFEKDGAYRLIISTNTACEKLKNYFSEYGKISGEGTLCASFTKEHWSLIEQDTALAHISAVAQYS